VPVAEAAPIGHQAAGPGVLAVWIDRRQRMAGRQRRELFHALISTNRLDSLRRRRKRGSVALRLIPRNLAPFAGAFYLTPTFLLAVAAVQGRVQTISPYLQGAFSEWRSSTSAMSLAPSVNDDRFKNSLAIVADSRRF
jgi:hypothetical protein